MPLPDLNIHEVQACRLTLQNITTLLLIPIVYFIDLTPHGIMHSELSKKFMAIKGLLMTQCKDGIVSTALKMTEVEPVVRPCLSFNRYPGANSDGMPRVPDVPSFSSSSSSLLLLYNVPFPQTPASTS